MRTRVGVGILNYNGARLTISCVDHLKKLDWPAEQLEIVVVDNGSTDDSVEALRAAHPEIRLIASTKNRGFAGGCNLAIQSMEDVDYVALLNNDAMVEPAWLEPLVRALKDRPDLGAVCSKVLFASRYAEVRLESPTFEPVGLDTRERGVRVNRVTFEGQNRLGDCVFPSGFYAAEVGSGPRGCRWTDGDGVIRIPVDHDGSAVCTLDVSAETTKPLTLTYGESVRRFTVGKLASRIKLDLNGVKGWDMINNVGSELVENKRAADRGISQMDSGQFQDPEDVFAWCGCSVLLSPSYLEDVGLFDERFFLYYEDFDLSWRGQKRGWSYMYEPASVVRHIHAATTGENSDLFKFYVCRNRLLVLIKNAPASVALGETVGFLIQVFQNLRSDLGYGELSGASRTHLKVLGSLLANAPGAAFDRILIGLGNRRFLFTDRAAAK